MTAGGYQGAYLDAAPLLARLDAIGAVVIFPRGDWRRRAIARARAAGVVTHSMADNLAVHALGTHPGELWPEWFDVGERVFG